MKEVGNRRGRHNRWRHKLRHLDLISGAKKTLKDFNLEWHHPDLYDRLKIPRGRRLVRRLFLS